MFFLMLLFIYFPYQMMFSFSSSSLIVRCYPCLIFLGSSCGFYLWSGLPGCVTNMVKSLKWENLEDRRKSGRLNMLFKIQHDLIDIDRQPYLTPNDSRTRGKNRLNYQERSSTDNYGQSKKKKKKKTSSDMESK
jgi:hypothetical protein